MDTVNENNSDDVHQLKERRGSYASGNTALQMSGETFQRQGEYTINDLYSFREKQTDKDNTYLELIEGAIISRSAPDLIHQEIVDSLLTSFRLFIRSNHGKCHAWSSPVDVQIIPADDKNLFMPDILIVCDDGKLSNHRYVVGAPDLVVEVLSKSTRNRDMGIKQWKYRQAGVREYWIIDPEKQQITVFDFVNDDITTYSFHEKVPVGIYDGKLIIDFQKIYDELKSLSLRR